MLGGFVAFRGEVSCAAEENWYAWLFLFQEKVLAHIWSWSLLRSQMGLWPTLLWRPSACLSSHCLQRDFFPTELITSTANPSPVSAWRPGWLMDAGFPGLRSQIFEHPKRHWIKHTFQHRHSPQLLASKANLWLESSVWNEPCQLPNSVPSL